ncbi:hypothetical protein RMCBS344292_09097 [Rhizopus microsporus]|nr:hypothetical protein RMCBS344292_09097 [Rhizopus microsporus]
MSFVNQLETLISKATDEYDKIAKSEPKVKSSEDGTSRGDILDEIIKQQQAEKKKLWNKLYKVAIVIAFKNSLSHHYLARKNTRQPSDANKKKLMTLIYESKELEKEVKKQDSNLQNIPNADDNILEIQFREQLDREVEQYEQAIQFLKAESEKVKINLAEEKKALVECQEVYKSLKARRETLMETNPEVIESKMQEHMTVVQSLLKKDTRDLVQFLDEFYPPHPIDENNPLGDDCDLKKILEQLMNLSYTNPDDPYVTLVPGTYWKPYIETLAKAGIIRHHPEDANQVCLEDFKM